MDNVFAVAFNYFRDPSDADDIVQEVLLKLLKSDVEFESDEHIRNWLLKVAVNQCRKVSVSSWFRKSMPLQEYAESLRYEDPEESALFFAKKIQGSDPLILLRGLQHGGDRKNARNERIYSEDAPQARAAKIKGGPEGWMGK